MGRRWRCTPASWSARTNGWSADLPRRSVATLTSWPRRCSPTASVSTTRSNPPASAGAATWTIFNGRGVSVPNARDVAVVPQPRRRQGQRRRHREGRPVAERLLRLRCRERRLSLVEGELRRGRRGPDEALGPEHRVPGKERALPDTHDLRLEVVEQELRALAQRLHGGRACASTGRACLDERRQADRVVQLGEV